MAIERDHPQPRPLRSFLFFFVIVFVSIQQLRYNQVRAQSQEGYISIDCGFPGDSSYRDPNTGVNYTGDLQYIETGNNHVVSENPLNQQYGNLRSFPEGARNCYKLSPVAPGKKYLVRAGFLYANYDGQGFSPTFDIHLGVDFWTTARMGPDGDFETEIITVSRRNELQVCLINTGGGTPFISLLELRPLLNIMYPFANASQFLENQERWNYGTASVLRYPDDPYDRLWNGVAGDFLLVNTTNPVQAKVSDAFQVPSKVLQTAVSFTGTNNRLLTRAISASPGERVYIVMHFAELVKLNPAHESRQLNIYGFDGQLLLFANYSPPYLMADHKEIFNAALGPTGFYNITVAVTNSSTRQYIINGLESFIVRQMNESCTDDRDVSAIEDIKRAFRLTRNWEADPCSPRKYVWKGVTCGYGDSGTARIISLNLSSSGLVGEIPSSIGNLTALTALDLSDNNLTGPIPNSLANLPSLQFIKLSGDEAIGSIPQTICDKMSKGVLSLSINGDLKQCNISKSNHTKIIIAVAVAAPTIILLILLMLWIIMKRKTYSSTGTSPSTLKFRTESHLNNLPHFCFILISISFIASDKKDSDVWAKKEGNAWKREGVQFNYEEIKSITRNFRQEIGKGGFGTVYLGNLKDGVKVAVKVISASSSQGSREFQAEVQLLARVHHKNLVCLLGYCDEEQHLSLVYEYMDNGSLRDHLSGKISDAKPLNWDQRVFVALQAAQGIDYLHNGCRPPIVHRDIKTNNILLNSELVAKISDFGLSRAFGNDTATHITTGIAGTPGYLDPEYHQSYRLNEKSDVYSFGIVLLEILTGQPPYQKSVETTHIVKWVKSKIDNGDISSIIDPRLNGAFDLNMAWNIVETAMSCTSSNSQERMTMSTVVMQLKQCVDMIDSHSTLEGTRSSQQFTDVYPQSARILSAPAAR